MLAIAWLTAMKFPAPFTQIGAGEIMQGGVVGLQLESLIITKQQQTPWLFDPGLHIGFRNRTGLSR